MKNYSGAVEVMVRVIWHVDADFAKFKDKDRPSRKQMLKALRDDEDADVFVEETLEVLDVKKVYENLGDAPVLDD